MTTVPLAEEPNAGKGAGERPLDVLVVGAGPTGIALGAAARRAGLSVLVVERGSLTQSILDFPVDMTFFTTRDLLEIADVPFAIATDKPTRREALRYYRAVVGRYEVPVAPHEEVLAIRRAASGHGFTVVSHTAGPAARAVEDPSTAGASTKAQEEVAGGQRLRHATFVVMATGYFDSPRRLGVPGEDQSWVQLRYREPYAHFGENVAVIGGGNSACEAALDLWRNGARVTLIHRGAELKPSVKYWLKPDVENRLRDGSIRGRLETAVTGFATDQRALLLTPVGAARGREERMVVDAAYTLIGYVPDTSLLSGAGVLVDPASAIPSFDPVTGETNVSGLFLAGTLRAGRDTNRIFIENSRQHASAIVEEIGRRLAGR